MAETRHRTTVEINVDDREVRGLGETMDRAFSLDHVEAFERAVERTNRGLRDMIALKKELAAEMDREDRKERERSGGSGGGGGGQGGGGGRGGGGGGGRFWGTAAGAYVGTRLGRMGGLAGAAAGGQGLTTMVSGIPLFGPALGGAIQTMMASYQIYAAQQTAQANAFGATGMNRGQFKDMRRQGQQLGYRGTEVPGILQGLAGQTLTEGSQLADIAPELMSAKRYQGFNQLGSVVGAAGTAGGAEVRKTDQIRLVMQEATATGFQIGMRATNMDQFFSQMSGWISNIRTQGIELTFGSAARLATGLGKLVGNRGERVQGLAQQLGPSTLLNTLQQGGMGAALLTQSTRDVMGDPDANFEEVKRFVEGNSELALKGLLQRYQRSTSGLTADQLSNFLQNRFRADFGVTLNPIEAHTFAQNLQSGDLEGFEGEIEDTAAQRTRTAQRAGTGRAVTGTARAEAAYENRRAGIGGSSARTVQALRTTELNLAEILLKGLRGPIILLTKSLNEVLEAFKADGFGAAFSKMMEILGRAFGGGTGPDGAPTAPSPPIPGVPTWPFTTPPNGPVAANKPAADQGTALAHAGMAGGTFEQKLDVVTHYADGLATSLRQLGDGVLPGTGELTRGLG